MNALSTIFGVWGRSVGGLADGIERYFPTAAI